MRGLPIALPRLARPTPAAVQALRWLGAALAAERDRWVYWLPVLFGAGIAGYFALPFEPAADAVWAIAAGAGLAAALALRLRRHPFYPALLASAGLVLAGFAVGAWRTQQVAAPMLARAIGPALVEGRVIGIDGLDDGGSRVLLDQPVIEDLAPAATPARVRIRLRDPVPPPVGSRIAVLAILDGPSRPVLPGGFDFRRQAFFQRLGGIGFALRPIERLEPPPGGTSAAILLERAREALAGRITAVLGPGDVGAIATAFMTGERGSISAGVLDAMRDSGLTHLLSISGLHVGLVALLLYGAARFSLALIEPVALRYPIKKWAALIGIAAALFYTALVGMSVPTLRSFLMYAVVFGAILFDRNALSLRSIALAAMVVLAVAPESLPGPSFQMSFAAVAALITGYEALQHRIAGWRAGAGRLRRAALYAGGLLLTSLLATAATAPFAIFHFQRLAAYGLIANFLAVPLTSILIMPAALVSLALMPLGLERLALIPMGWGIDMLIAVADWTAGLPGAALLVPAAPGWGLVAAVLGGLWLMLWRRPWRLIGLAGLVLGALSIPLTPRPDILVSDDARLMAVRDGDGRLSLSTLRGQAFVRDIWLRADAEAVPAPGAAAQARRWPGTGPSADDGLTCDPRGCLYRRAGLLVALDLDRAAAAEDCAVADVVVAAEPIWAPCPARLVIDFFDVWRNGATALYLGPAGVRSVSVAELSGDRPWTIRRQPSAPEPAGAP